MHENRLVLTDFAEVKHDGSSVSLKIGQQFDLDNFQQLVKSMPGKLPKFYQMSKYAKFFELCYKHNVKYDGSDTKVMEGIVDKVDEGIEAPGASELFQKRIYS